MAKTYPVKFYTESMQGAGQTGDDAAGAMIAILKACLVDGFGALTPSALVWDDAKQLAKATFGNGHAYAVDSIIVCSGSAVADYNGEHRVIEIDTNNIWFELDTVPLSDASGSISIKIAPLGWTITHANATNDILIFKPAGDLGNVSLRIDNTAFSGWSGSYARLMKVAMVENVTDINTYDTIFEHRWPATGKYSDKKWDLVGDNRMIFFMPEYGLPKNQAGFYAGYIDTLRAGDRYHFIINHIEVSDATHALNNWSQLAGGFPTYTQFARNFGTSGQVLARKYHQLEGVTGWMKSGLKTHNSDVIPLPNPVDNGFYINSERAMVLESDNSFRGFMPVLVHPLAGHSSLIRKNLKDLPEHSGKTFRMLNVSYDKRSDIGGVMVGFDVSTVEIV